MTVTHLVSDTTTALPIHHARGLHSGRAAFTANPSQPVPLSPGFPGRQVPQLHREQGFLAPKRLHFTESRVSSREQ